MKGCATGVLRNKSINNCYQKWVPKIRIVNGLLNKQEVIAKSPRIFFSNSNVACLETFSSRNWYSDSYLPCNLYCWKQQIALIVDRSRDCHRAKSTLTCSDCSYRSR